MREAGFYWVSIDGCWVVARWISGANCWAETGDSDRYFDKDMTEIDERRIVREEVK